tara:strand:- start:3580 stop:4608 length:1029 start_codon:yes stop_codon:yes gene_type:complete
MTDKLLTICIPSYNRIDRVKKTLLSLLDKPLPDNANIIIIDNDSDIDYESFFKEDLDLKNKYHEGQFEVIRNKVNIGLSANLLRSFEVSTGKWMWLLSDDDDLADNAILKILDKLKNIQEDIGFIKFSSERSQPEYDNFIVDSFDKFIDFNSRSVDDFNSFLFISNGIYRISDFLPLISIGFDFAHTYMPHYMMLIKFFLKDKHCIIYKDKIVDYVVPQIGYSYSMVAGLGVGAAKHIIFKSNKTTYQKFINLFFPHNDIKVLIDLYYNCKANGELHVFNYLSKTYISYISQSRSKIKVLLYKFLTKIFNTKVGFELVISLISKKKKYKKHIIEIKNRYDIL